MAVTLTDTRTIVNEADATTNWTGSVTVSTGTADPAPVESTNWLGMRSNAASVNAYVTITSADLTNQLVYFWYFPRTVLDTRANGGLEILLGDGTDRIGFRVAGDDVASFRHDNGPTSWQCAILDCGELANYTQTVYAGSFANLNVAAITQIGIRFLGTVAAQGNVPNVYWDIVRRGSSGAGLVITGGTVNDPGLFSQIAVADRGTGNQQAYGVLRQLAEGAFGVQGPLTFGDTAGTAASYFADKNVAVIWEERGVRGGRYPVVIQGNATGSTTFQLGTKVGTGDSATGTDGCTLAMTPLSISSFTASDADLQFLKIYGSRITGFRGGITLSSNATNGPNHEFIGNIVDNCGTVEAGRVVMRNNTFTNFYTTTTTGAASAYISTWTSTTNIKRCSFAQGTPQATTHASHAIRITATGTYDFDGIFFTGYSTFARNSFQTTADVDGTNEIITLDNAHGQTANSTWPAFYQKRGGTAAIGITDGIMYWLRAIGTSTVYVYDTKTNADAGGATGRQNLTASGAETHWFEPGYAAVYNDSGGSVTINVINGGNTPSVRNSSTSSTTVNNAVTLTISNIVPDSEVRIYTNDVNKTELGGVETSSGGVVSATLVNGGIDFAVNDTLTFANGTYTVPAIITVTSVDGGGQITGYQITTAGSYTGPPPNPTSPTATSGIGDQSEWILEFKGSYSLSYNYTVDTPIIIVVFHLQYKDIWLTGQSLLNSNQNIPVQQITDRVFLNPNP